jgi:signal transduction histidine kinase/ActR/RegA family two-component response regulator
MILSHRVLFAAAIAVPLGLLALAGWLNFRQVHAETERGAMQSVRALSEHAQRTFRTHELIIEFVDRYVQGRAWHELSVSEEAHRMLAGLAEANRRDVTSVFLLDPSGQSFISSRRFPMPRIDASDRDYFRHLREKHELYVSAPSRSRVDQGRFFTVAKRRSSADGSFDGLIAVSVDPVYFEAFYATLRESPQDSIALIRADGTMLVRDPPLPADGTVLAPDSAFMQLAREQPESGVFTARSRSDGVERVFAYHRVGDYPVYASYNTSMGLVWSHWRGSMLPYTLASLLAMGLLLVGAAFAEQRTRRAAAEARGREAEQANRAKDLFVAALSHELRNPLSAIAAASETLQRDPGARTPVQIIARQIKQLRRMLDDLLDTARAVHGKLRLEKRRVELVALARAELAEQISRSSAHGAVQAAGEAWVDGDPVRLRQMLGNLIENAIKYGARRVDIDIEADTDWVELAVRDDGQGLAPELLPRLFEPFVQGEQALDRAKGGLGLGLALVQRLAVQHGGTLAAESAGPGRGSTFTLRLPCAEPPARLVGAAAAEVAARPRRLLIVDDEPDARESLRALLQLGGHTVAVAADGPAGLAQVGGFEPEVALLDIGLPGMDGYELARRMQALAPGIGLVAISGYGQAEDRERGRAAGFAAHLTKPFTYEELARTLAQVDRAGPEDPRQRAA